MGLAARFRLRKPKKNEAGKVIFQAEVARDDMPEGVRALDAVLVVRWQDLSGNEKVTADVVTRNAEIEALEQYEIAVGMMVLGGVEVNKALLRLREKLNPTQPEGTN